MSSARCRAARLAALVALGGALVLSVSVGGDKLPRTRRYENRLVRIPDPRPLLADHPDFVQPITEKERFEAPALVDEEEADLEVRAWRFSYNARGIIEIPNRLRGDRTAIVVVHPWGIDDGQGWRTPEPAGCAFQCTPEKNRMVLRHVRQVLNPFVASLRGKVALVVASLPGKEDPIRGKIYRSMRRQPGPEERARGREELAARLRGFDYNAEPLPTELTLSRDLPVVDYFRQFRGLDPGPRYNNPGFWELPIPVVRELEFRPEDVVVYDAEGYERLRDFLKGKGIRHVLLTGYNTDMCVISTTAGHANLRRDFNVFLVGDATIATSPAQPSAACATTASVAFASLDLLITQCSWVRATER